MIGSGADSRVTYPMRDFLGDMWGFIRPHRWRFFLGSAIRALSDVAWLYPAFGLASIVDFLVAGDFDSLRFVWTTLGFMLLAVTVRWVGMYVCKQLLYGTSERMAIDARQTSIQHLMHLPMRWHEQENTGNRLKRFDRGALSLDKLLRIWTDNVISIVVNLVGVTLILATFNVGIAFATFVFLVTFFFLARYFIVRGAAVSRLVSQHEEDVHGTYFELLNNIRTTQVLHMGPVLLQRLATHVQELYALIVRRIFWYQFGNASRGLYGHAFRLAISAVIILGIVNGVYEVGFLVLFNSYFSDLFDSIRELSGVVQDVVVSKYDVGRMMDILSAPAVAYYEPEKIQVPQQWKELTIARASFSYGGVTVLDNVSVRVQRGERLGLVGLSGAGKSTLFKLLTRERALDVGTITLDDVPLHDIERADWLAHIGVVLQDTEVFNLTLRDNITLASPTHADDSERLHRAMAVSHVDSFLHKLPQGVDTFIGEKGVKLSGGERQRLGIARAVFKEPELLLLDEATSHLDVESEEKIQASLHEFFQSVTAIVIAHRLTTIKEMDRILVLEQGRIVEEGTFEELYARRGRFFELWEKQRL